MPTINENTARGLPPNIDFQWGQSNVDQDQVIEKGVSLPWPGKSAANYLYYECTVGAFLDSGIVVHNRLPQVDNTPDTLASASLDDPNLSTVLEPGVNLHSMDRYKDISQRMAHSRYWFRLWGKALRIGYPVPIPGLKSVGGVLTVPYDRTPQLAYNAIVPGGNYGGAILWRAVWSIWYTTLTPPTAQTIPAVDLAAHISGVVAPPSVMQAPYSQSDDDAVRSAPSTTRTINPQTISSRPR